MKLSDDPKLSMRVFFLWRFYLRVEIIFFFLAIFTVAAGIKLKYMNIQSHSYMFSSFGVLG